MPAVSPQLDFVDLFKRSIVPIEIPLMRNWLCRSFYDRKGNRFNENQVPWVTAPNGPCDAMDNPRYNEIWLQWASRMFKTTFGQAVMQRQAQCDPSLMMFATRNENLCRQIIRRFYETLEVNPAFRDEIPTRKARNATTISFQRCKIVGTWAGSKSGLADESIMVGHANEVDKWEHPTTSEEGDPLPRFLKRGGEFPNRKFVIESTPSQKGVSRVERGRENGTNCRYWVPCPFCEKFQPLEFTQIEWEGRGNADMARRTSRYVCTYCNKEALDEHRYLMVNHGVWVHAGCQVDHTKAKYARDIRETDGGFEYPWMIGEPLHDSNIYSSQLSAFYALFQGWGDISVDFLRKRNSVVDFRQWITEEKGETWEPTQNVRELPWQELIERMVRPGTVRGMVPDGFSLVTVQFDRQSTEKHDKPFPYMVCAWDNKKRCHIVDYDYVVGLEELLQVVRHRYVHQDEGDAVSVARVLADSGFEPGRQLDICRNITAKLGVRAQLCKGSTVDLNKLYNEKPIKDRSSKMQNHWLIWVDTLRSQDWAIRVLHRLNQDDPEGLSVYDAPLEEHEDLGRQLLNDEEDEKGKWNRIHKAEPNDYRDCLRYGKICMERETRSRAPRRRVTPEVKRTQQKQKQKQVAQQKPPPPTPFLDRPGGWI